MERIEMGSIALELLKHRARHDGMLLGKQRRRDVGNIASETGISLAKQREFAEAFLRDLLDETYGE